jgi:hypothetical protein
VRLNDSGDVRRHDSAPGGLGPTDEGRRFNEAATDAIRRAAPEVDTGPLAPGSRPDLVILATDAPIESELRSSLHSRGCAYLLAHDNGDTAVIGPLVLPGLTTCVRCCDLHRIDRDRAWSALAVQLATPPKHAAPNDVSLSTFTASVTALQSLAHIDGDEPATLDGALELQLPDWRVRRRTWHPHTDCDCGAYDVQHGL